MVPRRLCGWQLQQVAPPPAEPPPRTGKKLLDDLKQKGESLLKSNPNSDRLQPYKSQYMRLCKLYVDAMKEHQRSKVGAQPWRRKCSRRCERGVVSMGCGVGLLPTAVAKGTTRRVWDQFRILEPYPFRSRSPPRRSKCASCSSTQSCGEHRLHTAARRRRRSCARCAAAVARSFVRATATAIPLEARNHESLIAPLPTTTLPHQMAAHDPAGLIREAIMDEASEEAQQAFSDAQSRARDVEMLVRSLNEVAALFQDLAVLVQHQSEMLDSIEENVETAGERA